MTNYNTFPKPIEIEMQRAEEAVTQEEQFKAILMKDLMTKEFSDIKWIIEQLIPAQGIIAISGAPSAYKTWLILDSAIKIATGAVLFGQFITSQTGVLLIDEETGERWIKERITKLHRENFDIPFYLLSKTGFKLTEKTAQKIITFVKKKNIEVVIFDSLLRIHTATDENNAVEMAKVFALFQKLNNAERVGFEPTKAV